MNWTKIKELFVKTRNFLTEGNTPVKLFFLVLSIFLWFLIKLSNEGYSAVIEFPVKYQNLGDIRTFGKTPNNKISVQINSQGFNILKYKMRGFASIKVDVSKVERKLNDKYSYWLTNSDLHSIENQLGPDIEVRSVFPDTIFFDFTKLVEKKVAVELKLKKNYSKDLSIYGKPILKPDSIIVRGPESVVRDLGKIQTELLELTGEEESREATLELKLPKNKDLKFSHSKTKALINFSRITEGHLNIPIEIVGLPQQYDIKIFPSSVKLTYHVAIQDYEKVKESDFRVFTDCSSLIEDANKRYLNLESAIHPDYIDYLHFEPKRVEFILSEK